MGTILPEVVEDFNRNQGLPSSKIGLALKSQGDMIAV